MELHVSRSDSTALSCPVVVVLVVQALWCYGYSPKYPDDTGDDDDKAQQSHCDINTVRD